MSWLFIYGLFEWSTRILMVPVILRRRFAPVTSLAWLSIIFFLPVMGLPLYLLIGGNHLSRRRIRDHRKVIAAMGTEQRLAYLRGNIVHPDAGPGYQTVTLQAEHLGGMPILGGNDVELLADTRNTIDRLIADIDASQHHAHLLFYIFAPDETGNRVADALIRAAQRGVQCRLLADAAGSHNLFGFRHPHLLKKMQDEGVHVLRMLPASLLRRRLARLDLRNHRKLAIIDGAVAYTGSQNIVDADYGHRIAGPWFDLTGRFTGPVVGQLQAVFLDDWAFETDEVLQGPDIFPSLTPTGAVPAQVVPTGPTQQSVALLKVVIAAMNSAKRRIIITSPYLIPDEPTMLALTMAANREVEVNIVVPTRGDHPLVAAAGRAYFKPLLEAGVHIYQHRRGLLHAKTITVDDSFALLGSSNLDIRSFYLNFEINVLLYGHEVTRQVRFAQAMYISEADRVDFNAWRRRSGSARLIDSAASLLSPLL